MPMKFAVSMMSSDSYGSKFLFSKLIGHSLTYLKRSKIDLAFVHLNNRKMTKKPK